MKRLDGDHQGTFSISDPFWSYYQNLVRTVVIPFQEAILNDRPETGVTSHAIENYRIAAGLKTGHHYGAVFQDSDVAKWLEAAACSLQIQRDPELESRMDGVIELLAAAQEESGYLNTYFQVEAPDRKWTNLEECHELYCAGHLIEASVAYYESTGKDNLLGIAVRLADHIYDVFICQGHPGVPGHEEIELALIRLWRVTEDERYLELARHFINLRGMDPDCFKKEKAQRGWTMLPELPEIIKHILGDPFGDPSYYQIHKPLREQTEAVGHCVRAAYLYTAMADLAGIDQDEELLQACRRLWDNIVHRRMYITGGIGSTSSGEAFTADYDLPNDLVYAESCASVGLVFFASRMLKLKPLGEYADVMERALYNVVLGGMGHDGKSFFYVNPLEVTEGISGVQNTFRHVLPKRFRWHECACCPPNIARMIASLHKYAWGEQDGILYDHLLIGGEYRSAAGITVKTESRYPWEGSLTYTFHLPAAAADAADGPSPAAAQPLTMAFHVPQNSADLRLILNGSPYDDYEIRDGYVYIRRTAAEGDALECRFDLPFVRFHANPKVRHDAGLAAFMRGPMVYCFEDEDQEEKDLWQLSIPKTAALQAVWRTDERTGSYIALVAAGECPAPAKISQVTAGVQPEGLYTTQSEARQETLITGIPYYLWANRDSVSMRVWMREN